MKKYLVLLLSVLFLVGCGKGEASTVEGKKGDVYFVDNEVKLNDLKINILETKIIPVGEEGNYNDKPVLAVWYEVTNLSDKEFHAIAAWSEVFIATQDNNSNFVNKLEVGASPDRTLYDTQMKLIKKDGTVKNAIAYKLDDLETPVVLIATQGYKGKELGRLEIPVK